VLEELYGHGVIAKHKLENRFGIRFNEYFADELRRLTELAADGLVQAEPNVLRLTSPLGCLLVFVVAAVFDR
jgi:oxygen-independent coproporphyrinogen-3 oxidase